MGDWLRVHLGILPIFGQNSMMCLEAKFTPRYGIINLYVRKGFRKTNIFQPLTRTRTCAYQRVRNVSRKILCMYEMNDP